VVFYDVLFNYAFCSRVFIIEHMIILNFLKLKSNLHRTKVKHSILVTWSSKYVNEGRIYIFSSFIHLTSFC